MRLPEPTTEEILDKVLNSIKDNHAEPITYKISTDTAITTPGMMSVVITAGIIWAQLSALWLFLAIPLALLAWAMESKHWLKNR